MNKEWIEELLARVDLVSLISKYVKLIRKGSDYWGCCPFHHEKEPSFKIYAATSSYHCFGCKESGNAISFLSKIESIERSDAIKMLAESVGMELPEYKKGAGIDDAEIIKKKERSYSLLTAAARFYYENLQSPQGASYKKYLLDRGIDDNLIKKFGIGASLDWHGIVNRLTELGFDPKEMKEAGVAEVGTDGYYDFFKGRVMFPIINQFEKVVSFSGRITESGTSFAKYKNGAQTLVFDKSKTLFGINLLKKRKRVAPIEYVILVEGHIDVVMMHKAGFDTTVASMGTALTFSHAKQLKNFCDKIYISYDGDAAGAKATMKGLDILDSFGLDIKVIDLPEGKDPDDVIKTNGNDYYKELMKNAFTLPAYKINVLKKQYDMDNADGKAKFAMSAVKVVKNLTPVERERYLGQIAEITGYSMNALKKQADIDNDDGDILPTHTVRAVQDRSDEKLDDASVYILAYIAAQKPMPDYVELDGLLDGVYAEIYNYVAVTPEKASVLYSVLSDGGDKLVGSILNYKFGEQDTEDEFVKYVKYLSEQKIITEKEKLSAEYKEKGDLELLKKMRALDEKLKQMKISGR